MSGADVEAVCREAAMLALREKMDAMAPGSSDELPPRSSWAADEGDASRVVEQHVSLAHFERAARTVRPSISAATLRFYAGLQQQLEQ